MLCLVGVTDLLHLSFLSLLFRITAWVVEDGLGLVLLCVGHDDLCSTSGDWVGGGFCDASVISIGGENVTVDVSTVLSDAAG